jgi:hypothetical protein
MATNKHATIDELLEAVFSTWSALRLNNKDYWDKSVSQSEVGCEHGSIRMSYELEAAA